ncbi:MAG: hypothetical protein FWG46_02935 [Treponema sp.]|nr:hypothetical protein [Treponema sp.]
MKNRLFVMGMAMCLLIFAAGIAQAQTFVTLDDAFPYTAEPVIEHYQFKYGETVVQDFTLGERWATFGLNLLVPGLGSFVIMKDWYGGTLQVLFFGAGLTCTVLASNNSIEDPNLYAITLGAGLGFLIGNFCGNIIRSAFLHKQSPYRASLFDPTAWDIAVLPGNDGIEQVSLSYTLRF